MEDNSKDAELRARVPQWMFEGITNIATSRGEQTPVILREAVAEYLAKRVATGATPSPTPTAENILQALHDRPDIAETLIVLGKALQANSAAHQAAADVIAAAAGAAGNAPAKAPLPSTPPVKYKVPRRPKH